MKMLTDKTQDKHPSKPYENHKSDNKKGFK